MSSAISPDSAKICDSSAVSVVSLTTLSIIAYAFSYFRLISLSTNMYSRDTRLDGRIKLPDKWTGNT